MIFGKDLSYCSYNNPNIIGTLNLYESIPSYDVITNTHYSYACCKNMTSITSYFIDKQTYTYTYSFSYEETKIKDQITYLVTITGYNFSSYDYISYANYSNTGYIYDMSGMFKDCTNITNAELKYMNISNCENMDNMFDGCYNLKTITFGEYCTKPILHCENLFKNCYNLETVYIPYNLRHYYTNIEGQNYAHVQYYQHEDIELYNTSYSYIENEIWEPKNKFITFKLNNIGCMIIEDNMKDLWDTIRIKIGNKEIFSFKHGQHQPTDILYADAVIMNNYYVGKTVTISLPYEYELPYLTMDIIALKGMEYICHLSEHLYFNINNKVNEFDIHSIYLTKEKFNVTSYVEFENEIVSYTRTCYSTARGTFNIPELIYDYPDGDNLTIIDAKTGNKYMKTEAKIDTYNYTSYVLVDADVLLDDENTYFVKLDNKPHDIN